MKHVSLKILIVVLANAWLMPWMFDSASAHRVNVFAWVEGDTVYVEGKFAGGKKVKTGKVLVMDLRGNELLSGLTNDQGEYAFKAPGQTDLKIVVSAGQGHQGEWIVRADEMHDLPSAKTAQTGTDTGAQRTPDETASETSADMETVVPQAAISPKELETIIESVLDEKLKPIHRALSEIRQEGPSAKDVFAGIGYILGLVGIAAYFHSRKKKA
jgi:nickel transport protein